MVEHGLAQCIQDKTASLASQGIHGATGLCHVLYSCGQGHGLRLVAMGALCCRYPWALNQAFSAGELAYHSRTKYVRGKCMYEACD